MDWNYRGGPFRGVWTAARCRNNPNLPLISAPHTYAGSGVFQIAVKVTDVPAEETFRFLAVTIPA